MLGWDISLTRNIARISYDKLVTRIMQMETRDEWDRKVCYLFSLR